MFSCFLNICYINICKLFQSFWRNSFFFFFEKNLVQSFVQKRSCGLVPAFILGKAKPNQTFFAFILQSCLWNDYTVVDLWQDSSFPEQNFYLCLHRIPKRREEKKENYMHRVLFSLQNHNQKASWSTRRMGSG